MYDHYINITHNIIYIYSYKLIHYCIQELKNRRPEVIAQLSDLQEESDPIIHIMTDEDVMKTMETLRDSKALLNYLTKEHKVNINI